MVCSELVFLFECRALEFCLFELLGLSVFLARPICSESALSLLSNSSAVVWSTIYLVLHFYFVFLHGVPIHLCLLQLVHFGVFSSMLAPWAYLLRYILVLVGCIENCWHRCRRKSSSLSMSFLRRSALYNISFMYQLVFGNFFVEL